MDREEAKRTIRARIKCDRYLTVSRKASRDGSMYNCPFCGSGTGEHGTGALKWYKETNTWSCFASCHRSGDVIDLHMLEKGLDFNAALEDLSRELGITIDHAPIRATAAKKTGESLSFNGKGADKENQDVPQVTEETPTQTEEDEKDYTKNYERWHEKLDDPRARAYFEGRGLSMETVKRDYYGFNGYKIIIPLSKSSYQTRDIDPSAEQRYGYPKGGKQGLFHKKYLHAQEAVSVFVTEGAFDASSVHEVGYEAGKRAIGLCGTSGVNLFLTEVEKEQKAGTLTKATFVICMDNDDPGRKAASTLREGLIRLGVPFVMGDICLGCKDANEALVKDKVAFAAAVEAAAMAEPETPQQVPNEAAAHEETATKEVAAAQPPAGSGQQPGQPTQALKIMTGPETIDEFMRVVCDASKPFEPIPTGITDLDRALEGGLMRKTLVTLGAPPAMGKTAIAQWILENVAKDGRDVLYLNLEMSREQLLARSLSRIVWQDRKMDLSAMDILRGYKWKPEQEAAIRAAAERYKREIAPHFLYNPDGMTNALGNLLEAMRNETGRLKTLGRPAPIVCVDYLQIVDHGDKDPVEGLKNAIFQLKDFAKTHDTVVLAIIAHNRASNKSGVSDMESGRDTSAIEYSGDVMLGLSYTAIEDHQKCSFKYMDSDGNPQEMTDKEATLDVIRMAKKGAHDLRIEVPSFCNGLAIKVMKSRFSESDHLARFTFDGRHSTFHQLEWSADKWVTLQEGETIPFGDPTEQGGRGKRKRL